MVKKKSVTKKAAVRAKKEPKNSLVANINRRKEAGTSRPKKKSTISDEAYDQMEKGWPTKKKKNTGKK